MKLVMKILFVLFLASIYVYVTRADIFGPQIILEPDMVLEFPLDTKITNWSKYFYVYDRKEGRLDDKYMTIDSDSINMSTPGNKYLVVDAVDQAGNKSSKTFEVKVLSGYQHIDFESFINNQIITSDIYQLADVDLDAKARGITDSKTSNAKIDTSLGSQNLAVSATVDDKLDNGVSAEFTMPKYRRYYMKYQISVDPGNNKYADDLIYLPILRNTEMKIPVRIAVNGAGQLVVIDQINDKTKVIDNTNLFHGSNTIMIELSVDDKLGAPDLAVVYLNEKQVYTIDEIDLGFNVINGWQLDVYSPANLKNDYQVNIDDIKISMIKNDLIG